MATSSAPEGLMVTVMNYGGVAPDEFDAWYDTEQIPERAAVPGVRSVRRWRLVRAAEVLSATSRASWLQALARPDEGHSGLPGCGTHDRLLPRRAATRLSVPTAASRAGQFGPLPVTAAEDGDADDQPAADRHHAVGRLSGDVGRT